MLIRNWDNTQFQIAIDESLNIKMSNIKTIPIRT